MPRGLMMILGAATELAVIAVTWLAIMDARVALSLSCRAYDTIYIFQGAGNFAHVMHISHCDCVLAKWDP